MFPTSVKNMYARAGSGGSFISEWRKMAKTLGIFQKQLASSRSTFAFDFVEAS